MTVMDVCDVFGGYFYAFDGSQSIFPVPYDAWREEVKNDDKLCFFIMERKENGVYSSSTTNIEVK
jgi:hypothetical protein